MGSPRNIPPNPAALAFADTNPRSSACTPPVIASASSQCRRRPAHGNGGATVDVDLIITPTGRFHKPSARTFLAAKERIGSARWLRRQSNFHDIVPVMRWGFPAWVNRRGDAPAGACPDS
jgi:hypothetical protein